VNQPTTSPTLDTLFKRSLARHPDALALVDPLNKQRITGHTRKRLTYAQADRAISAIAAHFVESGLPANTVIAIQLPATVEFALTVLAAHRAGLVVVPLPLLWRQAELSSVLNRTAARAIVTCSRIDGISYADIAMNAAAEAFSIRHVCGFGDDLPEGMASLDQAMSGEPRASRAVIQDGRKAALISFDVTSEGFRPVPRAHFSLIAGGLAMSLESELAQGATIMSAFAPMSFAGLCSSLVTWLLSGGTLVLHHPFDEEVFETQFNDHACDTLIAPAQLALRLNERGRSERGLSERLPSLRNVIGLWRMPEQVASSASWTSQRAPLTDVYLFGEAGLFGARRTAEDGSPALIKPGPHSAPREAPGASIAGEILLTPKGTLGLRGPMVPVAAYAPPPLPSDTLIASSPRDYVDTEYAARTDRATGAVSITAPPSGVMTVGGYRF
jgi:acyl-CoA synthetase (AMP-forming)/AMP-acid ligase II